MTDNTGNHSYGGVALGSPGYSTSGTGSTKYTVSKGLNGAIQLQVFGHAFQGGICSSGLFWEAGGGAGTTPVSVSVVVYWVK